MDPRKQATRPPSDYMGRGSNPQDVPVARAQKQAAQLYTQPGARVPNNTMVGREVQLGVAQGNGQIYSNPYGDWRGQGVRGTGIDYREQRPAWAAGRMMSQQPLAASEQVGDLRWAGQVNGSGGPLQAPPNAWVQNPGIAKEAPRYPGTGQPAQAPLPSHAPMAMEDLRTAQTLMPAAPDLAFASRVDGHPAEAALPSAGHGASPGRGGMPMSMPQPR